jgi:hypothetical protein
MQPHPKVFYLSLGQSGSIATFSMILEVAFSPGCSTRSDHILTRGDVEAALVKSPEDEAARRIRDALDAFESARTRPSEREVTGLLSWEKHRAGQATFRAFHGAEVVGRIFKRADHSAVEKDVYAVEVNGVTLPEKTRFSNCLL